ncbi:MAG: CHASE2 domain-containing protein [Planctomycetota bacterium]
MSKDAIGRLRASECPSWLLGAALALLAAAALLLDLDLVQGAEGRVTDWLFRHGRPEPPEPSDAIVHVDIDDNSLDTVGRWPWPRETLAQAVAAIDGFGARVIALDLLLVDPQRPEYRPDGSGIDHDRVLANTLKGLKARTVLAVKADKKGTQLSRVWTRGGGREKFQAILDLLRGDITLDAAEVIRRTDITGVRALRVRGRIREIKKIVIRQAAVELRREGELSVRALRDTLLPPEMERLGEFPEMRIIRGAVAQQEAAALLERRLPTGSTGHEAESVLAPLPVFAAAVDGSGMVNATQDRDGMLRRVVLRWEQEGYLYPQFGLAAAAAYLDLDLAFLADARMVVDFGRGSVDMGGDVMLLSWPRIDPERPVLRLAPHLSLGRILSLLRAETRLEEESQAREPLTRELVAKYLATDFRTSDLEDEARRPEIELALKEEMEFQLQGDGEETRETRSAREWLERTRELERGHRELDGARRQLRAALKDKLAFIGWNATGNFGDFYPTAAHERTPGIVAHAVIANSLLTGQVVHETPAWLGALTTLLLGLIAALATAATGPRLAFLLALLIATLFFAFNSLVVFSRWDTSLAMATPLAGVLVSWAGTTVMRAVKERREKAQLRRQFGARISKSLFDYLIDNPNRVHLEGEEREVTSFFSDLAGFTAISEQLDSRTTVSVLNRYMWAMNDELTKANAYVNKFLGDGIMAVWGAFAVDTPHAERACLAALGCRRRLEELNAREEFRDLPKLSMRIGIATGHATVGDCGAPPDLRDYTVIGDSVNLAARLESANKQFGTAILIDGRTKELTSDSLLTRPLGRITVAGQTTPTEVHELLALRGEELDAHRRLAELSERAVSRFRAGDLDAARAAWTELDERLGPSKVAGLYLAEIQRLSEHPGGDSDGVLHLERK